jgi:iron complex outermembrane receptor protein
LEEVEFERFKLQFGGRLETNHYDPAGLAARSFTGASGAAGVQVPLWKGGSFVANFNHSYRAPALEELYNHGPHVGNLTFENGDANLRSERSDGVEVSLRSQAARARAHVTAFRYDIGRFVYLAPTGKVREGLREAVYGQADARFAGAESEVDLGLHPNLWVNLGMDFVDAQFKKSNAPLPRIPPLRGRLGFEVRNRGLSIKPEVMMAAAQHQFFQTETRTAGYTVVNIAGLYTVARQHAIHAFSVNVFNAGNRLYRNHLSFIKDLAPEIGRGVRFTYTLRFF